MLCLSPYLLTAATAIAAMDAATVVRFTRFRVANTVRAETLIS